MACKEISRLALAAGEVVSRFANGPHRQSFAAKTAAVWLARKSAGWPWRQVRSLGAGLAIYMIPVSKVRCAGTVRGHGLGIFQRADSFKISGDARCAE